MYSHLARRMFYDAAALATSLIKKSPCKHQLCKQHLALKIDEYAEKWTAGEVQALLMLYANEKILTCLTLNLLLGRLHRNVMLREKDETGL